MDDMCFVLVYDRKNSLYTVNVLTAAIESKVDFVDVYLVPLVNGQLDFELLSRLSNRCRKIVVGVTFMTPQVMDILRIVSEIRRVLPKALIIAGGPHATGDPYGTITKLGFDLVVYGEGEATLIELLTAINNGEDPRVCGVAYLEDDKVIIKRRNPIDLDLYPPFPYWRNRFNPIEIMRGCYSACYFCQVTYTFGLPRYRSIDNIIHYSKIKLEKGLKDLRFIAPNAFGYGSFDGIKPNYYKLLELLYRLRSLVDTYGGRIFFGTFPSEVRPDSVEEDLVKDLRKLIDNKRIIIGAQSGSRDVLKKINRKHDVEDIVQATRILLENGFEVDIDFILGFGFETDEDVKTTLNLIEKLIQLGGRIHLHTFIPLPGTPLFSIGFKPLNEEVKKRLAKLVGYGKAYGYWIEQEKLASIILDLKNRGIVLDMYKYSKKLKISRC